MAVAEAVSEVTQDHIERWATDEVAFAEEACVVRYPTGDIGPIRLFPHQRQWLNETSKRTPVGDLAYKYVVASWPKRDGKSLLSSIKGAHRLFMKPDTTSYILANSEQQGGTVLMAGVAEIAELSPALQAMGPETETVRDGTVLRISVPALGTRMRVLPCNMKTVQGFGPSPWGLLMSDEIHAAQDPNVFDYLSAQCEAHNSQIVISSQAGPPTDDNPVYRLYKARREPEVYFDYREEVSTPWAKRLAALDKKTKPRPVYDRLWRNAWGARGQRLFDPKQVDACMARYKLPTTREEFNKLREELGIIRVGAGLDRALAWARTGAGDDSVWTAVGETREGIYVILQADLLPTGAENEVLAADAKSRKVFGVRHPILETYQCGDISGKIAGAQLIPFTPQRKMRMYNGLYELIANRRMMIARECKQLRKQLLDIMVDTTSAQPKFEGKPHDDFPDSLVWAIDSCDGQAAIMNRFGRKPRGF